MDQASTPTKRERRPTRDIGDHGAGSGHDARVQFRTVAAPGLDEALTLQLGVLLGRAYTDERHLKAYPPDLLAQLTPDIERVHAAPPDRRELMPAEYLSQFPTLRNAGKPAAERREALHFIAAAEGYVASHVSLWPQFFDFAGAQVQGGYIEDVATDPLHLGEDLAVRGMREAERRARDLGLGLLGLATGLAGYYERLGWLLWDGEHHFRTSGREGVHLDQPLYLLPLDAAGERITTGSGVIQSWRLQRFGDSVAGANW